VKQDIVEIWIAIVAMGAPTAGTQVHFDIAGARGIRANLKDGPAKIGPAFQVGEARMEHADVLAGDGSQFAALEPLVLPDGLDEPFRRETFVAQTVLAANAGPPPGIKVMGKWSQTLLLLEFWTGNVNLNRH
jgi:hypothetical protein